MTTKRSWAEYDRWNAALAGGMFNRDHANMPVYIDVDVSMIEQCAAKLEISVHEAESALIEAVASTLDTDPGSHPLEMHTVRFNAWRRAHFTASGRRSKRSADVPAPPPVIALLTVCVLAASRMGASSEFAAHAYYPRLSKLLGLDDAAARRLREDFRVTELYWRGLNEYLESNEGLVGLPTAYSLGFRYVGIPQSQALVRAVDRAKLPLFFRTFGLVPRSEVIPSDIERLLDSWIKRNPSPVSTNLQALWRGGKAQERIAGVAAVELAHWDGSIAGNVVDGPMGGDLRLTGLVRQQFGRRSMELSFAARFADSGDLSSLRIRSAVGQPSIGVIPAAGSRVRPIPGSELDPDSLVGAVLELADEASNQVVTRRPRRVVPFRRDDLLGVQVEIDRVQLADDISLLVKDEESLLDTILGIIDKNGHRGKLYRASPSEDGDVLPGLPQGWVFIDDVQLYAVPTDAKRLELQVLVPQTTAQLNFAGGLKLPGRIRKWSSLDPPEVRAAVVDAESVAISIYELGEERLLLEQWSDNVSAMVRPLAPLELSDGDYEVELAVNANVVSVSMLRLRSADTPDVVSWETCARLNYEVGLSSVGALTASATDVSGSIVVDGLYAEGAQSDQVSVVPVVLGWGWETKKSTSRHARPPIVLGAADPESCVVTGRHYTVYPAYMGGRQKGTIEGGGRDCGMTKTSPASPKWKVEGSRPGAAVARLDFSQIKSTESLGASWDHCLDALVHVGGGPFGSLERIASQAEGSSLFTDHFLRTLEGLGHIDVRRVQGGQADAWEANPAFLAETSSGAFVLAGVWSTSARAVLTQYVDRLGGAISCHRSENQLSVWEVSGLSADDLEAMVDETDVDAYVVAGAVERMLAALPSLGMVEAALDETAIPHFSKASIFDLQSASWVETPGVAVSGAYKLEQSFRSTCVWVDQQGAETRNARTGSIQLVKHLAARAAKRPLLGYHEPAKTLLVPLGADLPGLYGRAAMLCSGRPPLVSRATRSLCYPGVPRAVADQLNTLMAT